LGLMGLDRQPVTILPLALETAIEEQAQVAQFQILCRPDGQLELRLEATVPDAPAAVRRCRRAVRDFLSRHGVANVTLRYSAQAPVRRAESGKLPRVVHVAPP